MKAQHLEQLMNLQHRTQNECVAYLKELNRVILNYFGLVQNYL